MPTSGGLYWWTHFFASPKTRNPLSFLVGYSNTLGLVGGLCSVDYGFARKWAEGLKFQISLLTISNLVMFTATYVWIMKISKL